jgi:hypothetical protein
VFSGFQHGSLGATYTGFSAVGIQVETKFRISAEARLAAGGKAAMEEKL